MKKYFIYWILLPAGIFSAGKWDRTIEGKISNQEGNTDLSSFSISFSTVHEGDISIGPWTLMDTEIKFSLGHTRGELNNALYENDGNAGFLLDYQANQRFSPFFLFYFEFDSTTSLENRTQTGVGAKYRLTNSFSLSIAGLWELEEYVNKDRSSQFRWSIRPKYKKSFDSGIAINYIIFYKPLQSDFNNYLLEHYATVSLATKISWLNVSLTIKDKFNAQPPAGTKKEDVDISVGIILKF